MERPIARRIMLRNLAVFSAAGLLAACSKKPSCLDVSGLSPEEVKTRNETAAYTEVAADPAKKCNLCAQWVDAPKPDACGGCKVVKGPINPEGGCKLFVARPA